MIENLWIYIHAVIGIWLTYYFCLTAIPEIASHVVPIFTERVSIKLERWVPLRTRQSLYRTLFIGGLFFAGFLAWNQPYQNVISKVIVAQSEWAGSGTEPPKPGEGHYKLGYKWRN